MGWNSKGSPIDAAKSARRRPVASRTSSDVPSPVIRSESGLRGREARMWKSPGHCSPCMMSRSITWRWSSPSSVCRMAWLAVKCENLTSGDSALYAWNAPATRRLCAAASGRSASGE
uniref:GRAS4 n=1 Tax=Arundo donax TaxID=35708 RepID=A0A0A9E4K2_ARUDO